MKKLLLLLTFFCALYDCNAQVAAKNRIISIPVERNGVDLRAPWTGGMNSPQFSFTDLNGDNIKDIFVFDRVGDMVLTYLNHGDGSDTAFYYAPQYEELFPASLTAWALIRDYNKDGIPDIFTRTNLGIRVFKGRLDNNLFYFDLVSPLLMYDDGTYDVNIWTNIDDIPVFTDVNRDGDMDVLTFGILNGAMVEYYENQTIEHPGEPHFAMDSLQYEVATYCWGGFAENGLNNSITTNISCKGGGTKIVQGSGSRHIGSSIYNFDDGNDHDVDLVIGDVSYNNLVFVENCGDSSFAQICSFDSVFPACNVPVMMPVFPAAYGVDVNNDSKEDLLIAPNARTGARDVRNVMYYKNTDNSLCGFEHQSDTFLVSESLDFGTDSKPVFFDMNGDGLKDMVIGNYGYYTNITTYRSQLAVYRNTGTSTHPEFRSNTEDYNNFSNLLSLVALYPAFGDLDGDNKPDLLLGELNGYLHFLKNTGSAQASFPAVTIPQYFNLDIGFNSAPFIYDVNGDSLNDLVVGRKDGKVSYFWNYGTRTSPLFNKDSVNVNFGKVNVNKYGYVDGFSTPSIVKDSADNMLLFTGSERGLVFEFIINPDSLRSGGFQLVDSNVIKHRIGTRSAVSIADIDNDGKMEFLLGTSRGGLMMYSEAVWDSGVTLGVTGLPRVNGTLHIFPNPAQQYFTCTITDGNFTKPAIEIYNLIGERIGVESAVAAKSIRINTQQLNAGMYFIRITDGDKTYTGKVLISR